jgi:hypothetical protein
MQQNHRTSGGSLISPELFFELMNLERSVKGQLENPVVGITWTSEGYGAVGALERQDLDPELIEVCDGRYMFLQISDEALARSKVQPLMLFGGRAVFQ